MKRKRNPDEIQMKCIKMQMKCNILYKRSWDVERCHRSHQHIVCVSFEARLTGTSILAAFCTNKAPPSALDLRGGGGHSQIWVGVSDCHAQAYPCVGQPCCGGLVSLMCLVHPATTTSPRLFYQLCVIRSFKRESLNVPLLGAHLDVRDSALSPLPMNLF